MKKKIQIYVEDWAIDELDRILKTDYCKHRGFKMTRGDLIDEMIANFGTQTLRINAIPENQERR